MLHRPVSPQTQKCVIIVGPQQLSREGLRHLLETTCFKVVGQGRSLTEATRGNSSDPSPELIIHDLMPERDLEDQLQQIAECRAFARQAKLIVLVDSENPETLLRLLDLGVEAILSKDISANVLETALNLVLLGQQLFPTNIARLRLEGVPAEALAPVPAGLPMAMPASVRPTQGPQRPVALSGRERQILRCLMDGLPNKVIARALEITEATVKVHIKGLLRKTGMTNRTQAAIWAMHNGPWDEAAGASPSAVAARTALPREEELAPHA